MSRQTVQLRRIATINRMALTDETRPEFEFLYADLAAVDLDTAVVTPRPEIFESAPSRARRMVAVGDTLVPSLTGGTSWTSTRPLLIETTELAEIVYSTGFFSVAPGSEIDNRFLNYALSSKALLSELEAISNGVTMKGFTPAQLARRRVWLPSLGIQSAVADFLDSETARIDTLIAKKQRMSAYITEQSRNAFQEAMIQHGIEWPRDLASLEAVTSSTRCRVIHLSQCLEQLTNGFVGPTRDILVESGIRYIQSLHIKNGQIDFDRRPFFVSEEWHAEKPRIHLRAGDVVIVQTGDIGQVAVVPPDFGEASCHALQIARVRTSVISGQFLGEYLRSSLGYQSLLSRATGALHPHLEGGIRDVPVLVPTLKVQEQVVSKVHIERRRAQSITERLWVQIELLREHRQALITAAVTGEIEIPGVAA